ncbi:MAG: hypothetical protein AAFP13_08435 [Pseudomonadota bacterium]
MVIHNRHSFRSRSVFGKSLYPGGLADRAAFAHKLDVAIAENAAFLLRALNEPDEVSSVTTDDLLELSDAKEAALEAWDVRSAAINRE